jgi:hypothetical protein
MRTPLVLLVVMAALSVSCGSERDADEGAPEKSQAISPSPSPTPIAMLVGRWERLTTCQEMVDILKDVGMGDLAPVALAGNGLVPGSAKKLAKKSDICQGDTPRLHSHFFTSGGQFGSVDWNNQQVDDGPYQIIDADTLHIGDPGSGADFRYQIRDGGTILMLEPVISAAAKREALAHPTEFSDAMWSVTVAFAGHPWNRVDCLGWC